MIINISKAFSLIALFAVSIPSMLSGNNTNNAYSKQTFEYNLGICINGTLQYFEGIYAEENNILAVPLLKTLSNLGVEIRWKKNNTAILRYKDQKYIVDINQLSLVSSYDKSNNLLVPVPGSTFRSQVTNDDILIDIGLFSYITRYMSIPITNMEFNNDSRCLMINYRIC